MTRFRETGEQGWSAEWSPVALSPTSFQNNLSHNSWESLSVVCLLTYLLSLSTSPSLSPPSLHALTLLPSGAQSPLSSMPP